MTTDFIKAAEADLKAKYGVNSIKEVIEHQKSILASKRGIKKG